MARDLRGASVERGILAWDEVWTLPNVLSLLRILLIPVFLATYLGGDRKLATLVFAIASVSDLADGVLARLLNQRTALGAVLDPIADKLLGIAALVALVASGRLPSWLLVLSLWRDAVVVVVAFLSRREGVPMAASPSRVGKYATFLTNGAVILALVGEIAYAPAFAGWAFFAAVVAGECLAIAAFQYAGRFALSTRGAARAG